MRDHALGAPAHPLGAGARQTVRGFIAQAKYLRSQSAMELERRLGFKRGRLASGYRLWFLLKVPQVSQFEFRGYTQMSGGVSQGHLPSPPDPRTSEKRLAEEGVDLIALKRKNVRDVFRISGADRLAKVEPLAPASGRDDYPPGSGIPQWEITARTGIPAILAASIGPGEHYTGMYS